MVQIESIDWSLDAASQDERAHWLAQLEHGKVLHFVQLPFLLQQQELAFVNERYADPKRKNISLNADGVTLLGATSDADAQSHMRNLIARFRAQSLALVHAIAPNYRNAMRVAPTSLRLQAVQNRATSWRKDDSRLHVDAFPSRPNQGERILRVFTNINPAGQPRVWRLGEPFEAMAQHMLGHVPAYKPWQARMLHRLHVTKSLRSEYDHTMLHLHDQMKADMVYQKNVAQRTVSFAAGSTWVCFSDQVSHAAMAGQYMLEQTLHLPVDKMHEPSRAPLHALERMLGHPLMAA